MSTEMVGRLDERAAIVHLVDGARRGVSGALVLRGEAGIGKTALVDFAVGTADGFRVIRTVGVEAEMGYPFAALHRLLVPFLDSTGGLRDAPRAALLVALGLADGPPADGFLVGLAALSMLADVAAGEPLMICIDDAQWVDQESLRVLGFVARRVHAESIALLFSLRPDDRASDALDGIPTIDVSGLDEAHALDLLASVVVRPVDPIVAARVVAATGGNPLAVIDLGRWWLSAGGTGPTRLVEPLPLGPQLEAHYLRQVRALPPTTQAWLLVAAAEPTGDLDCITRASIALDLDVTATPPAERAGIVRIRDGVEFRHPLVRSAIYGGATSVERQQVHRALAAALATARTHDRRIWHLAAACPGPDDDIADELERSAVRAAARGGYAAGAEVLARAAELTADDRSRHDRLVAAADAALRGGSPRRARALLERLEPVTAGGLGRGRVLMLTADIDIQTGEPNSFGRAAARCLAAAWSVDSHDRDLARDALMRASHYAAMAEHLLVDTTPAAIAVAIGGVNHGASPGSVDALVLDAYSLLATDGYESAVPAIRRAVDALLRGSAGTDRILTRDLLGVTFSMMVWDDTRHTTLLQLMARRARQTGALRDLDTVLYCQSMEATIAGDLATADRYLIEGHQTRSALGATAEQWEIYRHPELLAWRGEDAQLRDTLQSIVDASELFGLGATAAIAQIAQVILEQAKGNYANVREVARPLIERDVLGVHSRVLPELVEAAGRSGDHALASDALRTLSARATASGSPRALGLLARSRALLAAPGDAEALHREAIERLATTAARADLARAHLLYGEWLRRRKRTSDAREQLRIAHAQFSEMGAAGFAERARLELAATGEHARKRSVETRSDLTPQEAHIAQLAAAGDTNAEIAEKLYISARTVDYHLRKVYRKLDVASRRDLRRVLSVRPPS
jgi:DNA-binding CsgD family transcriptional regulator